MKKRLISLVFTAALCMGLAAQASAVDYTAVKNEGGDMFSLFLAADGTLYGSGTNDTGQLGPYVSMNKYHNVPTPQRIADNVLTMESSASMCSQNTGIHYSGGHSLIIKRDGTLYGLGDNTWGQLGQGDKDKHSGLTYIMSNVKSVACSGSGSAAVTEDGELYLWGLFTRGNAGYWFSTKPYLMLTGVKEVACGNEHVIALMENGDVYAMGNNGYGALGLGYSGTFEKEFKKVCSGATMVEGGKSCTLVVKDGALYACGKGIEGWFGPTEDPDFYVPTLTKIADNVKTAEAGTGVVYYIKNDDSLWGCGNNFDGQLGRDRAVNVYAQHLKLMDGVKSVSAGNNFVLVLKKDGMTYAAGVNGSSEFGNNDDRYINDKWIVAGLSVSPFTDVAANNYYYTPVRWAVDEGITSGTSATTFSPESTCTRGQVITFLWRAAGCPEPDGPNPFADVTDTDYYCDAAVWAYEEGMVDGTAFAPTAPCTRAMAVEFMWKQAGSPKNRDALSFTDVEDGASYRQAVAWAVEEGVTTGVTETSFAPGNTCTRAQIATFLWRAFGQ